MGVLHSYSGQPTMAQRELHVFYVLDTSGSMRGLPINTLNRAMGESMLALQQVAAQHGNAKIKLAVLEFASSCRWMQPAGPEEIADFVWKDLEAGGLTNMGAALRELNAKLTKEGFLRSSTGLYMPVIIFMTDGRANGDYREALQEALENEYFRDSIRIGFAIGDGADAQMIAELTGDPKAVLSTTDLDLFADLLVFVTVSAPTMSVMPDGVQQSSVGAAAVERARRQAIGMTSSSWEMTPTASRAGAGSSQHEWEKPVW